MRRSWSRSRTAARSLGRALAVCLVAVGVWGCGGGGGGGAGNTAPAIVPVSNFTITAGVTVSRQLSATDAQGDPITWSVIGSAPTGFTLTSGGLVSWTPGDAQVGTYTLTIQACDSQNACSSVTFTVTVRASGSGAGLDGPIPLGFLDPFLLQKSTTPTLGIYQDFGLAYTRFGAGGQWGGALRWDMVNNFPQPYLPAQTDAAFMTGIGAQSLITIDPINKTDLATCGGGDTSAPRYPCDEAAYISYVKNGVNAVKSTTKLFQVHNEPMGAYYWNDTPANYARLVKTTSDAIHSVCSDCKVALGGMTPSYLSSVLTALDQQTGSATASAALYDIVDTHLFGVADMTTSVQNQFAYFDEKDILAQIQSLLQQHSAGSKPIWITETSSYDGQPVAPNGGGTFPLVSEEQQARDLVKRLLYPLVHGASVVLWSQTEDTDPATPGGFGGYGTNNFFNHTGVLTYTGQKKLSYWTYQQLAQWMNKVKWSQLAEATPLQGGSNVHVITAPDSLGRTAAVVWWDFYREGGGDSTTVKIQMSSNVGQAAVTTLVAARSSGASVNVGTDFPARVYTADTGNTLTFKIGRNPVVIRAVPLNALSAPPAASGGLATRQ